MRLRHNGVVFLGGGLGACARALVVQPFAASDTSIPVGVLVVNLTGAFILAVVWVLADEIELLSRTTRLFLAVGVLGGYTTFSTFGWGVDLLLAHRAFAAAIVYIVASIAGSTAAVVAGLVAGRELIAVLKRAARWLLMRLEVQRRERGAGTQDVAAVEAEKREGTA